MNPPRLRYTRATFRHVAFTGASNVRDEMGIIPALTYLLQQVPTPAVVTTGGATGIDTIAARAAWRIWPEVAHRLVYPLSLDWNRGLLASSCPIRWYETIAVPGSYMDRNDRLIEGATVLLAFPSSPQEYLRSGTWATVRRARKRNIPIHIFPLSDPDSWRI